MSTSAPQSATVIPDERREEFLPTLFALSHLSFRYESEFLSEGYGRLYLYSGDHPEASAIFQAIDRDANARWCRAAGSGRHPPKVPKNRQSACAWSFGAFKSKETLMFETETLSPSRLACRPLWKSNTVLTVS